MIHPTLIRKIKVLGEYVEQLAPYAGLDSEILLKNDEKRLAMERLFLLMVDEAVDINSALAHQLGGNIPEAYKSSFFELVPLKVLDDEFAMKISESARVRNELTHGYEKFSHSDVIASVKKFFEMYKVYLSVLTEKFIKPSLESSEK